MLTTMDDTHYLIVRTQVDGQFYLDANDRWTKDRTKARKFRSLSLVHVVVQQQHMLRRISVETVTERVPVTDLIA